MNSILAKEALSQMNLSIFLIEAADVPKADWIGLSDPYCILSVSGNPETQKSKYIDNTKTPKWNESFTFFIEDDQKSLTILLMDKDIYPKSDDLIASIEIPISSFPPNKEIEKWYTLKCADGIQGNPKIHLQVTLQK